MLAFAATVLIGCSGALAACGSPDPGQDAAHTISTPAPALTEAASTSGQTSRAVPVATSPPTPTSTPQVTAAAATTATPTPTPQATPTEEPPREETRTTSDELQVVSADAARKQRATGGGAALEDGDIEVVPDSSDDDPPKPTPTPTGAGSELASSAGDGVVYTYQDGEDTRRVVLQSGLTVRAGEVSPAGQALASTAAGAVVEGSGGGPVFRAEGGGPLMTLPGGVLLVLDPEWDEDAVATFLEGNAIGSERVSDLGWLPNGFLVETAPGFPSLDLANALAGQEGVLLAAPNWWREVQPQ